MALTKIQLLSLLETIDDNTEIVVPSFRNPATAVTQIARAERGINQAGYRFSAPGCHAHRPGFKLCGQRATTRNL
jgi:hypothetical protein